MAFDKAVERAEQILVVGERRGHGQSAGVMHGYAVGDQPTCVDQHSGGNAFFQPSAAQRARLVRDTSPFRREAEPS